MRVWACLVFVAAFACFGASIARAGAWLWPENHGQALLTTTFADAQKAYDKNGRLVATPPYSRFETQLYVEHGVVDGLNFVGEGAAMDFSGITLLAGLAILVISEVFREGTRLHEEQSLTI